ncbi:TRAP transporter small permease subunit [Rhodobacteraceae bacterium 2CG4]|uniref:TRAP transporter small permease protein n=1 Tax=Halovulum marinum TaxID=2662447 RepID=A0A6L5YX06_9RHOB|nr:TRAP transporter small permease subunit [Halovulum marinum]MSU88500.1 TRAP transporter small permease subunit [Halovulum marinum]
MRYLGMVAAAISALNAALGAVFAWLSLGIVVVCFSVVVLRYAFATSFVWMQDLYIWLSGAMFTAVGGFALLRDSHVRVDIFYRPASERRKAWVDLIGSVVFLLPFMFVVIAYSWPFVARSWSFAEGSANVGGMPGLFVLKSFILLFAGAVALQGIAMICRSILILGGRGDLVPRRMRYDELAAAEGAA